MMPPWPTGGEREPCGTAVIVCSSHVRAVIDHRWQDEVKCETFVYYTKEMMGTCILCADLEESEFTPHQVRRPGTHQVRTAPGTHQLRTRYAPGRIHVRVQNGYNTGRSDMSKKRANAALVAAAPPHMPH